MPKRLKRLRSNSQLAILVDDVKTLSDPFSLRTDFACGAGIVMNVDPFDLNRT
jgi:hypothetical protein